MANHARSLRPTVIFFIGVACYAAIICNLFVIQIVHQSFFASLGMHQYQVTVTQLPPRGAIVDRTGNQFLATNKACLSAFIVPKHVRDRPAVEAFLQEHFPAAAKRLATQKRSSFMYIKRRISDTEKELIAAFDSPDIHLLEEMNRYYPLPSAAPLIGFTDIENVGKAGLELRCNDLLTGTPEKMVLEKDARSGYFYFSKELQTAGTPSVPVKLTIDATLQFLVDDLLAQASTHYNATEASAIILNPDNGDILALSSYPFTTPDDPEFDFHLTKQRAVTEQYEMGSVLKVFAALAALQEKVVSLHEPIDCKNSTSCTINGRPITTVKAHGILPFSDVVAYSNNIGIAHVAHRLGPKLYDHYRRLGFGTKTGIPLPAETSGSINPPETWSAQSLMSLSYGYEISISLLQLAQAFALIAHDGHFVQPRLLLRDPITISDEPLYSAEAISALRAILRKTTTHGTGRRARIAGFDVLSKTGTANLLINGAYDHERNLYTAAATIEKGSYKRVIVTCIKEARSKNGYASTIAMPLLRQIAQKMIIHDRVV